MTYPIVSLLMLFGIAGFALASSSDTPVVSSSDAPVPCSSKWRIMTESTLSGWAWDIKKFDISGMSHATEIQVLRTMSSGSVVDVDNQIIPKYASDNVLFNDENIWGGRPEKTSGLFWIGVEVNHEACIDSVAFEQPSEVHFAPDVYLQYWSKVDASWITFCKAFQATAPVNYSDFGSLETDIHLLESESTAVPTQVHSSSKWRIMAESTVSGWAWDINRLTISGISENNVNLVKTISSGSASDEEHDNIPGYGSDNILLANNRVWGGRKDQQTDQFWVGVELDNDVSVTSVQFEQPNETHYAFNVYLQYWDHASDMWVTVSKIYEATAPVSFADGSWSLDADQSPSDFPPSTPYTEFESANFKPENGDQRQSWYWIAILASAALVLLIGATFVIYRRRKNAANEFDHSRDPLLSSEVSDESREMSINSESYSAIADM